MSIGSNIRQRRRAMDITQEQLAVQVGCVQSTIAQYERGSKVPTLPIGRELARILGCTLDELAHDSDNDIG